MVIHRAPTVEIEMHPVEWIGFCDCQHLLTSPVFDVWHVICW